MKKNNITTSIGTIDLSNISFVDDTLDIFIGIDSVSEDIRGKINDAAEKAKADYIWSKAWGETKLDLSLWVKIRKKEMSCYISIDIINLEDSDFTGTNIEVDLSEHREELKKAIVKAMVDNFF